MSELAASTRAGGPPNARPYGVVIADNDDQVRIALADLIDHHPAFRLVGQACDGLAAAELCAANAVDLAVVDVRMAHGGAEAVVAIHAVSPSTIVAGYTVQTDRRTRERMLDAGATAVFAKGGGLDLADELIALLKADTS